MRADAGSHVFAAAVARAMRGQCHARMHPWPREAGGLRSGLLCAARCPLQRAAAAGRRLLPRGARPPASWAQRLPIARVQTRGAQGCAHPRSRCLAR